MQERAVVLQALLARVRSLLAEGRAEEAAALIEDLWPGELALIFEELEDDERRALLEHLDPSIAADVLEELADREAAELAKELPEETLTAIVDEMEPDEAADLLLDLDPEQRRRILAELEDPNEVRPLLVYPDESAGGLMTTEFLALRRRMTVADALEAIRRLAPTTDPDYLLYLYVVDGQGRLVGQINLVDLIRADPKQQLMDIMDTEVISVTPDMDREEVARIFARYDLVSLPVVDHEGRLVGVITADDIIDVVEEEATEDIQRLGGSEPLDRPYLDTSPLEVARKRVGWLLLLFVTETFTGTVLRHFEEVLAAQIALSFFVPLMIGTGGNSGSQTTSTIIRAIALGEIDFRDAIHVLWHELRVGVLLGAVMGVIGFLRALTWGTPLAVAQAVAIALLIIVVWANIIGSLLPLIAQRLKIDPAVVSGPFMSTLVDATGLFIYLQIARIILGL